MTEQTLNLATDAPAPAGAPRWGGLLRSELRRARSRRSLRWMLLLLVLGVIAVSAIIFATTAPVDADDLEQAVTRSMAEQQMYYEQCLADPSVPQEDKEQYCYKPTEQDIRSNAIYYLDRQPFTNGSMAGLLIFAGGIAAVVALLMGASAGGADWGARTMGLLFMGAAAAPRVPDAPDRRGRDGTGGHRGSSRDCLALGSLIAGAHPMDPAIRLPQDSGYPGPADLSEAARTGLRWLPLGVLAARLGDTAWRWRHAAPVGPSGRRSRWSSSWSPSCRCSGRGAPSGCSRPTSRRGCPAASSGRSAEASRAGRTAP